MTEAFAGVRWEWIITVGFVLGCIYRLIYWKMKVSNGLRGLIGAIQAGVAFIVLDVLFHSSPIMIELTAQISLGLVIEALLSLMWSRRAASESGAKGLEENGPSSKTRPFSSMWRHLRSR